MTLYELTDSYRAFMDALEAGDIPDEAIADTLEALEGEIDIKIDNIAAVYKNLLSTAKAISEEIKTLTERLRTKEKETERIKEYLQLSLQELGRDKFESPRNKLTFRKSESVTIGDESAVIRWLKEKGKTECISVKESVKKTELKSLLATEQVPGVEIVTNKNIQIK